MKFAYLINAHVNANHVHRLVDRLNNSDTDFVIHVSKTSENGFYEALISLFSSYSNVYFCKREKSMHFGFGIVQATINGMETLLNEGSKFDYFHLLSGQDYPIKPNYEIFDFFKKNNGKEFMYFWKMFPKAGESDYENHPWGEARQEYRVDRFNFPWNGKVITIPEIETNRLLDKSLFRTLKIFLVESKKYKVEGSLKEEFWKLFFSRLLPKKRDYNKEFTLYGGKTWFSFSRELITHIVSEHNNTAKWKQFYKYSLIPDEMYFHTIAMDSSFSENVVNDYLREVEWEGGDRTHPIIFKQKDLHRLKNSKNFWARKFDNKVDSEILDSIDSEILN